MRWRQDSSYVRHFRSFRLRSKVLLEIVVLANSKKNRNIKSNDVGLISEARSTDFCFKTTCVGMFLCFKSIVCCFQCFVRGPSPFGKQFPMNPPYPLEITVFESPPPPLEFPMIFRGGGGGMDIFWNHTIHFVPKSSFQTLSSIVHTVIIEIRSLYHWGGCLEEWDQWKVLKPPSFKVVAVKAFGWILLFWISDHLLDLVPYERLLHMEG